MIIYWKDKLLNKIQNKLYNKINKEFRRENLSDLIKIINIFSFIKF
jgi:hypothetical protein